MKTRKHGNGMNHKEVVQFSNRMAKFGYDVILVDSRISHAFESGWNAACKYFAHELRVKLRQVESLNY